MRFSFSFKNKDLILEVNKTNFFTQFSGLMFRTSRTKNLLFEYSKDVCVGVHSYFVFNKFLIIWFDEYNRVLGQEIVKPFRTFVKPNFKFRKFVEVPINRDTLDFVRFFVGK